MFSKGMFFTGCNYWASHAGTAMWSDWRTDVVESDFKRLSENNIKVLRVFPLWPDFQPIRLLRKFAGLPAEYRIGENPLSDDEEGRAGVSIKAMEHFEEFAGLAEKYGLKLIVGLITGWMSGRLFVPPALEGRNVLTDPMAVQWEVRFVKYFVSRFRGCPAILAWDLGNECNCMADVPSAESAWNWISSITNAIRTADPTRYVVSGMHGLLPDGTWTIQDQAEVVDILTTHPYPYFTPHCDQDAINTIRTVLHAAAETLFYRGIGGKPCFAEECGTLGPMFASDEAGADFIRNNLFTLWAHDCHGFLWWCANEQIHLKHAPYDWNSIERELGFFRLDGSSKPVLTEVSNFTRFIESFPYSVLPERIIDGICILTPDQDSWGAAYSAFILAKQAGLDIEYQYSTQQLRDSKLYILPSLNGCASLSADRLSRLLQKVEGGAVLYISNDTGLLSLFESFSGVRVITREKRRFDDTVSLDGTDGKVELELKGTYKSNLEIVDAEIIGRDQEGKPAFTCARYGKGKVFFLNYPLETYLLDKPGVFHENNARPYWIIYSWLKRSIDCGKAVSKKYPNLGLTEHILDERTRIVIAVNYEPRALKTGVMLADGWIPKDTFYGNPACETDASGVVNININQNDAVVFTIFRK